MAVLGALVVVVTSIGAGQGVVAATARSVPLPSDPDAVVLTIGERSVVVLADGRMFRRFPATDTQWRAVARAEAPDAPPPLPSPIGFEVAQLTPGGLDALFDEADRRGLLVDDPDYGDPRITDQGTLDVVVTTAAGTFEHHVYAPDYEPDDGAAAARRDDLEAFIDFVGHIDDELSDDVGVFQPFVPERWNVVVDGWYPQTGGPWPFPGEPVAGCHEFDSDDHVDTVTGVYAAEIDGDDIAVAVDPVLVDSDCDK